MFDDVFVIIVKEIRGPHFFLYSSRQCQDASSLPSLATPRLAMLHPPRLPSSITLPSPFHNPSLLFHCPSTRFLEGQPPLPVPTLNHHARPPAPSHCTPSHVDPPSATAVVADAAYVVLAFAAVMWELRSLHEMLFASIITPKAHSVLLRR